MFTEKLFNKRILSDAIYAGLFVTLLLGIILPFKLDELREERIPYILAMGLTTTIISFCTSAFCSYVLKMPVDPHLPLKIVQRNSLLAFILSIPILAASLVSVSSVFFCNGFFNAWWKDGHLYLGHFYTFLYYVSAVCPFLYIGIYIRNKNFDLKYKLHEVSAINQLLEQRQKEMMEKAEESLNTNDISKENKEVKDQCKLVGSTNNSVLEIEPSNIIYVESMANYADICYIENDEPHHKTMRITLKQVIESLAIYPELIQCHRAFIVNLNFVVNMTTRNNGYQLQLFGTDKDIPVSRTHTSNIRERLNSYSAK